MDRANEKEEKRKKRKKGKKRKSASGLGIAALWESLDLDSLFADSNTLPGEENVMRDKPATNGTLASVLLLLEFAV